MPKKAYLASHFSTEELKEKYRTCQDPVEALVMASVMENFSLSGQLKMRRSLWD